MKTILLISTILFSLVVLGQHYKTKNYNIQDGLISSLTYRVLQDSKGFIWIATENGVSRFDGYKFENFNSMDGLEDNFIFDLYEDDKGRIWFLSFTSRLAYYENGQIITYQYNDSIINNIDKNIPLKIHVDMNDNLYIGFRGMNTLKIDNKGNVEKLFPERGEAIHVKVFENEDIVMCILPRQNIKEHSIVIHEKDKEYIIPLDDIKNYYLPAICKIDNEKYLFSFIKDLVIIDHGKIVEKRLNASDDLILNINKDSKNNLWMGTRYSGAIAYDGCNINKNFTFQFYDDKMASVTEDREGNYWITVIGDGVYFLPSFAIKNYKEKDGLIDNSLTSILKTSKGDIIISSKGNGLVTIKNEKIKPYPVEGFPDGTEYIDGLYEDSKGNIWMRLLVNNKSYLTMIRDQKVKKILAVFGSISEIKENPFDGHIYVGTSINFFRLNDDDTFTHLIDKKYRVSSMSFRKNRIFIGSRDGLFEIIDDSLHQINGFNKKAIRNIVESNNRLFVTTHNGLFLYKEGETTVIDKSKGLTSDMCVNISKENDTTFWLATNRGANKIVFTDTSYKEFKISNYTSKNGLIFDEIGKAVSYNDTAYIISNNGLSVFKEENIKTNNIPPLIYITNMTVNDSIIDFNGVHTFKHNQNNLHFEFIGISYRSLGKIRYRYKLLGLSNRWSYTNNTDIQYTTLPPGDYTFIVESENEHGCWSQESAQVSFSVMPPFWKTPIFLIGAVLFTIAIIWTFVFIRIRFIKKQSLMQKRLYDAERKALQSQMNPHFIFNALGSIQKFVLQKDIKNADKYLTKFAQLIRRILKASREPTVTLTEEIEMLKLYMDLEARRLDYKFSYKIILDKGIDPYKIQIPVMLIQPFVENSIWHGIAHKDGNGNIIIGFKLDGEVLETSVQDDGIGRKKAIEINKEKKPEHKSEGLNIINERLVLLNMKDEDETCIRFFDLKDEAGLCIGLKATIRIPLINKL